MEEQIVLPKTMLAIIEKQQAIIDRLEMIAMTAQLEADEAKATIQIWRAIADDLVYTEHDDYSHLHTRKEDPCVRCVAHNAYHEQVNREENQ
jgi:hypothetical protein